MKFLPAVFIPLAIIATGCHPMSDPKHPTLNLHPKQAYEITINIVGAPGSFDSVTGFMGYEIANKECVPKDPISGTRNGPGKSIPIILTHTGDTEYNGIVHLDLLEDDNYYGLGTCQWIMTSIAILPKKHGVEFSSGMFKDEIVSLSVIADYFSKSSYLDKHQRYGIDTGVPTNDLNIVKERPKDFFSIKISAKKVAP
ncbi:MAG: hypothetical protein ABI767_04755 [Rhodanobacter sp.]